MKITYDEILGRHAALMEIGKMRLPRKVSLAIARNITAFETEIKVFSEQQKDIAERYALKKENGEFDTADSQFHFANDEDEANFTSEMTDLRQSEVDVQVMTFDSAELDKSAEDTRYAILTPIDEAKLIWMMN